MLECITTDHSISQQSVCCKKILKTEYLNLEILISYHFRLDKG
jgi:hypothetical protein